MTVGVCKIPGLVSCANCRVLGVVVVVAVAVAVAAVMAIRHATDAMVRTGTVG
jgi:hypothetical protein